MLAKSHGQYKPKIMFLETNMAPKLCRSQRGNFSVENHVKTSKSLMFLQTKTNPQTEMNIGNLWTYIGYFRQHFPNDWSANCTPMVGESPAIRRNALQCIGAVGFSTTTPWRGSGSARRSMPRLVRRVC